MNSILFRFACYLVFFFFFQAEDGIRDKLVTGVQTCALPILLIRNQGETEIAGWPEYPYYLIVEGRPDSGVEVWAVFATYLRDVLRDAGLEAEINRWLVEAPAEATSDALAGRRG